MDSHDNARVMTRRYAEVNGEFVQLWICPEHDGDAADVTMIHPEYGRRRCPNRECLRRWEHQGKCP